MESRDTIEGWFDANAAALFLLCNQLATDGSTAGDVLEIGVHHGLSALISASLRGRGRKFYAVDLFEDQQNLNISQSGHGSEAAFYATMQAFYGDLDFLEVVVGPSASLSAKALGNDFTFCHIDGGHSAAETYQDIGLCYELLRPGGLLALDDYFNAFWPGVSEGAIRFALERPGDFVPLATGYNKVILQKPPVTADVAGYFREHFPGFHVEDVQFWQTPTILLAGGLLVMFDLDRSTPWLLAPRSQGPILVRIDPQASNLHGQVGRTLSVPVRVTSASSAPILFENRRVGLSYHLLASNGACLQWDNRRVYFEKPLLPGETQTIDLVVDVPAAAGHYRLQLDVVWEGVAWLNETGPTAPQIDLTVGE
jgi:predicted O-methyltransferase YrrM